MSAEIQMSDAKFRCGDGERPGDGLGPISKRSRKPCRNRPLRSATRCKFHGGTQQLAPPGDPRRGGRPYTSGIYARYMADEMRDDYADLAALVGTLDNELHVARAYLADAIKRHRSNPGGGIAVSVNKGRGASVRIRAYADIVAELTDRVRKLEKTRRQLLAERDPQAGSAIHDLMQRINAGEFEPDDPPTAES